MLWIQIVIFLLVAGGTMTLLNVNFKDFFQLAARGKPSTLKDDLDAILGKPAKGFFNRETVEIEQLLKTTGREGRFTMVKRLSLIGFSQQPVFNPSARRGICFCTGLVFALYRHDL